MTYRQHRAVSSLALASLMLLVAGCGSFASTSDQLAASRGQLAGSTGGTSTADGAVTTPGSTIGNGPSAVTPGTSSTTTGTTGNSTTGATGGASTSGSAIGTSGAGGVTAPAGGNGGATDIGVTANSITVGNVSNISGPVPGLARGAGLAVQAYFAYINSLGGVFGRSLKVDIGDDGLECAKNQSVTAQQIKRNFAQVGGFSLQDSCGAKAIKGTNVPDVTFASSNERAGLPNNFSVQPVVNGAYDGHFRYFKSTQGDAYQHAAGLFVSVGAAISQWNQNKAVAEKLGYQFLVNQSYSPTETNFTSTCINMRSKGVKLVFIFGDAGTIARFMSDCKQQNYTPVVNAPGIGYDKTTIKLGGSAIEGLYENLGSALYFNEEEGRSIPAVGLFQKWMAQAAPGQNLDSFSIYGWTQAELFVQALRATGPKVTRAALTAQLKKVTNFDDGGLFAPSGPGNKTPLHCYIMAKFTGGRFVRIDSPAKGFRCDGSFVRL